jgi:N-acetyl-anhydromuramyl-L-alanine amidase AmpD
MIFPPFGILMQERMHTKGPYPHGLKGAIVHFTAGRGTAPNVIRQGVRDGYAYWCIGRDGVLYCAHSADARGAHCGESRYPGLVSPCHNDIMGIEVIAAGTVKKVGESFHPWYYKVPGDAIPANEVRLVSTGDYPAPGYYHIYTPAQEQTLLKTLRWLKEQFSTFSYDFVLGHDEVSGKKALGYWRKVDPGGAISRPMPEFRKILKGM